MGTFIWWFGIVLVIIAVALGVNEVRQDRDRLRSVAIVLGIGLFVVFVPPLQLLRRAEWRAQFGTFASTATPPYVDLCGRRFYSTGSTGTLAEAEADQGQLKVVASTPAGTPILAYFSPPPPGGVCTGALYDQIAPNRYLAYVLSGGP